MAPARFGQQNTTTRLWSPTCSRPRTVKQQQFEYAYLFGSVCINNGASEAMVVPFVNKNIMVEHLAQISRTTVSGRHTVIIMDGAGWYSNDIDAGFNNISTIQLLPYSPELNLIE